MRWSLAEQPGDERIQRATDLEGRGALGRLERS